jgi:hypothetical protein
LWMDGDTGPMLRAGADAVAGWTHDLSGER